MLYEVITGVGQQDQAVELRRAEAIGPGGLHLTGLHPLQATQQDGGLVGGGVEAEGQQGAVEGIPQQAPQAQGLQLGASYNFV